MCWFHGMFPKNDESNFCNFYSELCSVGSRGSFLVRIFRQINFSRVSKLLFYSDFSGFEFSFWYNFSGIRFSKISIFSQNDSYDFTYIESQKNYVFFQTVMLYQCASYLKSLTSRAKQMMMKSFWMSLKLIQQESAARQMWNTQNCPAPLKYPSLSLTPSPTTQMRSPIPPHLEEASLAT